MTERNPVHSLYALSERVLARLPAFIASNESKWRSRLQTATAHAMGFRELVHIVGKLCKRLTRRRAHFEPTTKPTEPAEMTTIKTDVQFASPAKDDNTRTPTKGVNLDNLPTELLLAIVSAASQGWRPRLRLLATMAQVNRRLAIVLLPEARRTFHVLSGRQIETLHTLPYTIRVQCRTLFVEARPPLPDGQQSAVSTYPCPNLLPGEIPMALQLLPAVNQLHLSFRGVVTHETRRDAFRFSILMSPNSPFNSEQAFLLLINLSKDDDVLTKARDRTTLSVVQQNLS